MEVNAEALEGLGILGDSTLIPDTAFASVAEDSFNFTIGLISDDNFKVAGVESGLIKQCTFGILTAIYVAARVNADASAFGSVLEECKWTPERIDFITRKFEEYKDQIQVELARIGYSYPHIVDVDWRLDYYIKNNYLDKVNEPSYLISLKTQKADADQMDFVQFSCSIEQLQDLVGKLRDATKSLEKASQA